MDSASNIGADAIAVVIKDVAVVADGVIAIDLVREDAGEFPRWRPGAHIDVLIGAGLERQYSLCGDVHDVRTIRIAVLRDQQSRGGSSALHERIKAGDHLFVRGPRNNFPLIEADEYVLVAGGIGITPILPMIMELQARGKSWKLLYGGRALSGIAFAEQLSPYGDRVRIQPQDEAGLLDVAGWIGAPRTGCVVYCCGPESLIKAVEAHCAAWPENALQVERFKPAADAHVQSDSAFDVVLAKHGATVRVAADETIAGALERVGVHIPRSCNEGTCGTCITKVLDGVPDHRDSFLRGRMRAENKRIMVCCSRSKTEQLVLDI